MSRRQPPTTGTDTDALLALAAARLALRLPDAGAAGGDIAAMAGALMARLSASRTTPLARIVHTARLSAFDLDLLGLAALTALDDRAGTAVLAATGLRRATAGFAARLLLPEAHDAAALRRALRETPLWRAGLMRTPDPFAAPGERLLDPTPALLAGLDGALPETAGAWRVRPPRIPTAPPGNLTAAARAIAAWIAKPDAPALAVATADPARAEAAVALAGAVAWIEHGPGDPPWAEAALIGAAMGGAVALAASAPPPADLAAPLLLVMGPEAGSGALPRIVVPPPATAELDAAWRAAGLKEDEAQALSVRTWLAPEDVARVARRGTASLAAAVPKVPGFATIRRPDPVWDRLVVDTLTRQRLEGLLRRVRRRARVRDAWSVPHAGGAVAALLTGESGTGKTLAAEAVAARLDLPLLTADLSRVVSKYIGETEKQLEALFAAAEGFAALLFFDEADALFGKRTDVQDAHDRYANIEVAYLLQRLERFEGIALLATNLSRGVDEAFLRRFDLVIPFARPDAAARAAIWKLHLPKRHLAKGVDPARLAVHELTGGEIRNAALSAAYDAADADTQIGRAHLDAAIAEEFAKKGRPFAAHGP